MLGIWNDPDIRDYRNQAHQRYVLPLTSNHGKRSSISLRPNVFSSECSWTRGQEISLARNSALVDHFSETAGRDLHSTTLIFLHKQSSGNVKKCSTPGFKIWKCTSRTTAYVSSHMGSSWHSANPNRRSRIQRFNYNCCTLGYSCNSGGPSFVHGVRFPTWQAVLLICTFNIRKSTLDSKLCQGISAFCA